MDSLEKPFHHKFLKTACMYGIEATTFSNSTIILYSFLSLPIKLT